MSEVKPGMSAKEIAILFYKLVAENNQEEWLKTVRPKYRKRRAKTWWSKGRERHEAGFSYTFRHKDKRYSKEERIKFFFKRLDKDGEEAGTGMVPITVLIDEDDNKEWRVETCSW